MGKDLKGKELGKGIRQRKDKKYIARFQSRAGKRPEKAFDKITDAKKWLDEQRYLDEHSNIYFAQSMTVDAWWNYWLENIKKPTVRITTYINYQSRYNSTIKNVIGFMLLSEVKPLHCQKVLNEMKGVRGTKMLTRICMGQMFSSAVDNGILDKSPIVKTVSVGTAEEKEERRVFSQEEQDRFEKYLATKNYKYTKEYLFCLETGLRMSELRGLMWSDIQDGKLYVRRQRLFVNGELGDIISEPKSKSGKRMIPLTAKAREILAKCKKEKILSQYVFHIEGGKTTRLALNNGLRAICKRLEIEPITMHGLRHSFATRCIERGMRPKTLQKILGHSKLQMTMDLYVHVTDETLEEEMLKVEMAR